MRKIASTINTMFHPENKAWDKHFRAGLKPYEYYIAFWMKDEKATEKFHDEIMRLLYKHNGELSYSLPPREWDGEGLSE